MCYGSVLSRILVQVEKVVKRRKPNDIRKIKNETDVVDRITLYFEVQRYKHESYIRHRYLDESRAGARSYRRKRDEVRSQKRIELELLVLCECGKINVNMEHAFTSLGFVTERKGIKAYITVVGEKKSSRGESGRLRARAGVSIRRYVNRPPAAAAAPPRLDPGEPRRGPVVWTNRNVESVASEMSGPFVWRLKPTKVAKYARDRQRQTSAGTAAGTSGRLEPSAHTTDDSQRQKGVIHYHKEQLKKNLTSTSLEKRTYL
ncbi:hypothetical protein EVAR_580_1 [Eumeta japonica]|uniref:Uncharacterized protein n=1 Tax=Eumeta variegata TaxID=151549 RepID=A0A4C1SBA8_EUMVA|nr:hypothetical protein EVAR_580_1 [Eumeta japonica]